MEQPQAAIQQSKSYLREPGDGDGDQRFPRAPLPRGDPERDPPLLPFARLAAGDGERPRRGLGDTDLVLLGSRLPPLRGEGEGEGEGDLRLPSPTFRTGGSTGLSGKAHDSY